MTDGRQKRSSGINLSRLRKHHAVKPLAISVATVMLGACSDPKEEAMVFTGLSDCKDQLPNQAEKCEVAYKQAVQEAARTAPKYGSERDCEYDFGSDRCVVYRDSGSSFFMPLMAGYIIRDLMSPSYRPQPMFTSYSRYSPYRYRWITAGGYDYGDFRYRNLRVPKKYSPPPTVNRTIKRGGFGSSVRAKSSWGSSRKGWGG